MAHITQELAKTVTSVGVKSAYGDPVELDGTKLVPVALTSFGFGGGQGSGADGGDTKGDGAHGEGEGAGGGGFSAPVGAYVTRDGFTRFEPNVIALLVVGVPFVWVAGRALSRVIRALKK